MEEETLLVENWNFCSLGLAPGILMMANDPMHVEACQWDGG